MKSIARVVLLALLAFGYARAADVCSADVEKFCGGTMKGEGRVLACLQANAAQLSPVCKQHVGAIGKKVNELGAACGDDIMYFCPDVKSGQGRVLRCLQSKGASLSPGCGKMVAQFEEKSAEFKKACGDDVEKHCKGVPRGQGRILGCLTTKQAELAPACKTMMQQMTLIADEPAAAGVPAAAAGAAGAAPAAGAAAPPAAPAAAPAVAPAAAPATPAAPPPAQDAKKK
jgi:hypothetical protein